MTKVTYVEEIKHNTDAEFRAWVLNLSTALQGCGLVKTADTGQIDIPTAIRPGGNQWGGFEVYQFADALQATAPIFVRINYGTGSQSNAPIINLGVGTGTNGEGLLTGANILRGTENSQAVAPAGNSARTFVTHTGSTFFLAWGSGGFTQNYTRAQFTTVVDRARDDAGVALGEGAMFLCNDYSGVIAAYILQFGAAPKVFTSIPQCIIPDGGYGTMVGTDVQLFRHSMMTPRVRPLLGVVSYLNAEIGSGAAITASPLGTPHTYLPLGSVLGPIGADYSAKSNAVLAVLWED